ncbi:MAG: hypothetical protein KY453_07000 [Gemmatimonadetes bacterium]|nr:hypothetical protein [Gemmatimonadota bacterium]
MKTMRLEVSRGEFDVCLFADDERVVAVSVDIDSSSAVAVFERLAKAIYDDGIKPLGLPAADFTLFARHPGARVEWTTNELLWHPGDERYSEAAPDWRHPSHEQVRETVGPAFDECAAAVAPAE